MGSSTRHHWTLSVGLPSGYFLSYALLASWESPGCSAGHRKGSPLLLAQGLSVQGTEEEDDKGGGGVGWEPLTPAKMLLSGRCTGVVNIQRPDGGIPYYLQANALAFLSWSGTSNEQKNGSEVWKVVPLVIAGIQECLHIPFSKVGKCMLSTSLGHILGVSWQEFAENGS